MDQKIRVNIPAEWKAFQENARRFPNNPKHQQYGIVNPSANSPLKESDMLYAADPRTLHDMHYDNWPPIALRNSLDWLERAEGKR